MTTGAGITVPVTVQRASLADRMRRRLSGSGSLLAWQLPRQLARRGRAPPAAVGAQANLKCETSVYVTAADSDARPGRCRLAGTPFNLKFVWPGRVWGVTAYQAST